MQSPSSGWEPESSPGEEDLLPGGIPAAAARRRMVRDQLEGHGIDDPRVLAALAEVPRHRFVDEDQLAEAHADRPLSIGCGQTISQPFVVAFMTQALCLSGREKVLEVGTGCGYQTAILARLAREVHSLEIVPELSQRARRTLDSLGVRNASLHVGDGSLGLPAEAPFDAVLVAAAAPRVPEPLVAQLADGGRLVLPVGEAEQDLVLIVRHGQRTEARSILSVRFVPLLGKGLS